MSVMDIVAGRGSGRVREWGFGGGEGRWYGLGRGWTKVGWGW